MGDAEARPLIESYYQRLAEAEVEGGKSWRGKAFDESEHPREPAGGEGGGQFASGGGGGGAAEAERPSRMSGSQLREHLGKSMSKSKERKAVEKKERARLHAIYQRDVGEARRLRAPADPAKYEAAREAWFKTTGTWEQRTADPLYVALQEADRPADPAAAKQAEEKMRASGAASLHHNDECRRLAEADREEVLKALEVDEADRCELTLVGDASVLKKVHVKYGGETFRRLVSRKALRSATHVRVFFREGETRAHYGREKGENIILTPPDVGGRGRRSMIHELGHHLESVNPKVRTAATTFRRERCLGAETKNLGSGYGDDEVYLDRTDGGKWINNYMGKVYSSGDTEIVSMGLELYATKPLELLEKDPEMFELIAGICRGEYSR